MTNYLLCLRPFWPALGKKWIFVVDVFVNPILKPRLIYDYNPSPILSRVHKYLDQLKKQHIEATWSDQMDANQFTATLELKAQDGKTSKFVSSCAHKSQKLARADTALRLLYAAGIDVSKWEKIFHKKSHTTPMDEINKLCKKYPDAKLTINRVNSLNTFHATLQLGGKKFEAQYPYHKDHRYVRHKLCFLLLQQAAPTEPLAFDGLVAIEKRPTFVFGRVMELQEDYDVEFKGSKKYDQTMDEKAVADISTSITKTICGFLNTNGGSIFVGIDDKRHCTHGIKIKSVDEFQKRWQGILKSRISPVADHLVRMQLHPVVTVNFPTTDELKRSVGPSEDSENKGSVPNLDTSDKGPYVASLEQTYRELLLDHKALAKNYQQTDKVYVFQITVLPAKCSSLYFADNIAYRRHLGANETMSPQQLREFYFHQFQNGL